MGDGQEHGDDPAWDAIEAESLYDLLEREVVPEFYKRDGQDVPGDWIARMRESMARLTPRFSAGRSVREYTERYYFPAAAGYRKRAANGGTIGTQLVDWRQALDQSWAAIHFGDFKVTTEGDEHFFEVQLGFGDLDPALIRVELYADGVMGRSPVRQEMKRVDEGSGTPGGGIYRASMSAERPAADYTPRVTPHHNDATIPLEEVRILWQR